MLMVADPFSIQLLVYLRKNPVYNEHDQVKMRLRWPSNLRTEPEAEEKTIANCRHPKATFRPDKHFHCHPFGNLMAKHTDV